MASPPNALSLPDTPRVRTPPPGPRSRELLDLQAEWETPAVVYAKHFPLGIARAQGSSIEDVDGNRFIDWVAGVCVFNLGHQHPRLRAAMDRQLDRVAHALELPTEARIEFLRELRPRLPGGLKNRARTIFSVTGGDAVETAVSIADYVKGRRGTIVFSGAYHGVHGGAVGLTSGRKYHRTSSFGGAHVVRVPYPDPYRPVLSPDGGVAGLVRYLEHLLSDPYSGVDEVSSMLVEPILGEGGYVVPPPEFLPALREVCDRHDLLLIADEVQTGLGRTGKRWAVEHSGVTPDLLCIGKSIGGGVPLALVAYRDDLAPELPAGFHLGTFRANPVGLAAGVELLRELDEGGWVGRVAERGPKLVNELRSATASDPTVGEVRGQGFMIGLEFVRDARGRTPFGERAKLLRREMFGRGLLMHTCGANDQVLRFMAPLTIEEGLLERGVAILAEAVNAGAPAMTARATGPARGPAPAGRLGPAASAIPPLDPIRPGLPL